MNQERSRRTKVTSTTSENGSAGVGVVLANCDADGGAAGDSREHRRKVPAFTDREAGESREVRAGGPRPRGKAVVAGSPRLSARGDVVEGHGQEMKNKEKKRNPWTRTGMYDRQGVCHNFEENL